MTQVTDLLKTWHQLLWLWKLPVIVYQLLSGAQETKHRCDCIGLWSWLGRAIYTYSRTQFCVCLHADADDGSEYQDGSEGEEEQDSRSGDEDKASADEVLDEVVDDLAEEEGSYEDSLEDVGGSDDESID